MAKRTACIVLLFCAAATCTFAQTFTKLVDFDGTNGANQTGYIVNMSLVQGLDGNFYGTTFSGKLGLNYSGTIFQISPSGALTTLYNFCLLPNCADGDYPFAGLVLGADGNFYGATSGGGLYFWGTIFRITPAGELTTLYSFCAKTQCPDGANPTSALVRATDGNFYGTTSSGGAHGGGTVFKVTPSGDLTTLYNFCAESGCADGAYPFSGIVQAIDGNFYGTTESKGAYGEGTAFKLTLEGTLTVLHSFCEVGAYCPDGWANTGTLMQGFDGQLYGTNGDGGVTGSGTAYSITTQGVLTTLYAFCAQPGCSGGSQPFGGLCQARDGNFYGATVSTLFEMTPEGVVTTLHTFDQATDGGFAEGTLLESTNGNFYGVTNLGGSDGYGTVFSLSTGLGPFIKLLSTVGNAGQNVQIIGQGFKGTTAVSFNGTAAKFTVMSGTSLTATVPVGATTGKVTVTTPNRTLVSNVAFRVRP